MTNRLPVWTTTVALALLALVAPQPAHAGSCSGEDSGIGEVEDVCGFTCETNEWIIVGGMVDDGGFIRVEGSCGGMTALCAEDDGDCSAQSPEATPGSGAGPCEAFGNGGAFTRISYNCTTQDAGAGLPDVGLDPDNVALRVPLQSIHVDVVGGVASAVRCRGDDCRPVPVRCVFDIGTWHCRAG